MINYNESERSKLKLGVTRLSADLYRFEDSQFSI